MGTYARTRAIRPLLDTVVGFFVWAIHLLVIYIATALECQFSPGTVGSGRHRVLLTALALITVLAAALVLLHAIRRYRQQRGLPMQQFRLALTVGSDAIAAIAILWQLLAIVLVPACA
jgi:hypothetical protein